jgi:hypothetical protein
MRLLRRSSVLVALALHAIAGVPGDARAQQRPEVVRGVVRSGGVTIPYAVVELGGLLGKQFSDDSGAFRFAGVPAGTYRLRVRQVGFRPFDSTVVKTGGTTLVVPVEMEPLVIELAAINVAAVPRTCATPGRPDSAQAPELAPIFDQLRQNAERYAFLSDSYPFHYRLSRAFADYDAQGRVVWSATDTVRYLSSAQVRYRPGQVLALGQGPERSLAKVIRLPTLADFADSAFQANHCFYYAGTVEQDSGRFVRFDYVPVDSLRTPDIEGEVDLDARSFQIRRATIRLTRVGRAMPGLISTSSTITFAELHPNIVVPSRVDGQLIPAPRLDVRTPIARSTETQQLLDVRFVRPLPSAVPVRR